MPCKTAMLCCYIATNNSECGDMIISCSISCNFSNTTLLSCVLLCSPRLKRSTHREPAHGGENIVSKEMLIYLFRNIFNDIDGRTKVLAVNGLLCSLFRKMPLQRRLIILIIILILIIFM